MKRYDEGLAEFQKAVELEPDNALHYDGLSLTLNVLGRHDEAEAERQKAAELESK